MPRANRYFLPGYIWHITHRLSTESLFQSFQSFNRSASFKTLMKMTEDEFPEISECAIGAGTGRQFQGLYKQLTNSIGPMQSPVDAKQARVAVPDFPQTGWMFWIRRREDKGSGELSRAWTSLSITRS